MSRLSIMSEKLESLWTLSEKEVIFLDDLGQEFKPDLQNFIIGETLQMKENKLVIGKNLYKRWLLKVKVKGFDYEIDFK